MKDWDFIDQRLPGRVSITVCMVDVLFLYRWTSMRICIYFRTSIGSVIIGQRADRSIRKENSFLFLTKRAIELRNTEFEAYSGRQTFLYVEVKRKITIFAVVAKLFCRSANRDLTCGERDVYQINLKEHRISSYSFTIYRYRLWWEQ